MAHEKAGAIKYGQSRLDISDEMDLENDRARNDADHKKDQLLSRDRGIDGVLKAHNLDAIFTPGGSGAGLAARAGYPIIVVPFGMVPNAPNPAFPASFDAKPGRLRRWLHGRVVQRAAADRARLRVRAGNAGSACRRRRRRSGHAGAARRR